MAPQGTSHRSGVWDAADVDRDTRHITDRKQREKEVLAILDDIGFNWTVWIAVSAGFLASSYTIFSSNIIVPALQYVYPSQGPDNAGLLIDLVTIGTTTMGMLIFGHLADRLGRKSLYGVELLIIIIGSVGIIQSSDGFSNGTAHSLDIYAAIIAWRGIQGFGIGAEYPLSAIIAAEFSSTETRGTLMAAFFAMQSVARILAYLILYGAITLIPNGPEDHKIAVDQIWRVVVGISAVPAALAIGLRMTIPETPRYYTGITRDLARAVKSVIKVGGRPQDLESVYSNARPSKGVRGDDESVPWFRSAWDYLFGHRKGWKPLMGISVLWFLLDVAFYGTGLDSPGTLHRLWLSHDPPASMVCRNITAVVPSMTTQTLTLEGGLATTITALLATPTEMSSTFRVTSTTTATVTEAPGWNDDEGDKCASIETALSNIAERTLLLSSLASFMGSLAAIYMVNRFSRRTLMASTSGALCLLFLASGFAVWQTTETPDHEAGMVFFALTQFMFNMGPNTLTFIVAAESFPTVFRGTFYGVAAAAGKLGALLIRPVINHVGKGKMPLMSVLFSFSGVMLLMVVVSLLPGAMLEAQHPRTSLPDNSVGTLSRAERGWKAWLPRRLRNKTLEEIAPNPENLLKKLETDGNGVHQVRDLEHRRVAVGYAMTENAGAYGGAHP